jgi:RimJ/RimL family protein N-acetyltransferase
MATVMISTARLELVLQTPDEVLAWVASLPSADRAEVSADWIARVQATEAGDPWVLNFNIVERASGSAVGGCGFKGPPDADGVVEVAYGIEAAHRRRGFATEAANALVEFAFASSRVRRVRAHTKPGNSASTRVLAKCGFQRLGEVMDSEDGLVCRWEREPTGSGTAPDPVRR